MEKKNKRGKIQARKDQQKKEQGLVNASAHLLDMVNCNDGQNLDSHQGIVDNTRTKGN